MNWVTGGCRKRECPSSSREPRAKPRRVLFLQGELSSVNGSSAVDSVLTLGGYNLHLPLHKAVPKDRAGREGHLSSLVKMGSSSVGKTFTRAAVVTLS